MPDIRRGEGARLGLILALFFFLLAANTVIKIVRDSIFLSQHSAAELPYVYLCSGFLAGISIAVYSHYVAGKSLYQMLDRSLILITLSIMLFWYLLRFHNAGWLHYAFYIWSSIVLMVAVAQLWTFAEEIFTAREGKRLFGAITTGGTLGGILGAFVARWLIGMQVGTIQLLALVTALLLAAYGVCGFAREYSIPVRVNTPEQPAANSMAGDRTGTFRLLCQTPYLHQLGALILISVIVSTLLDFQFKVSAKETIVTAEGLAHFFASYYGWLSVITLLAGFALTGQLIARIGLFPSLFILPAGLLLGSLGFLIFPGFLIATGLRMSDASLRPTFYRSLTEMLYFPIPANIKIRVKTFLDVVLERLGDGSAGFIILFFSLAGSPNYSALVYCAIALIALWIALLPALHRGYLSVLLDALTTQSLDGAGSLTRDGDGRGLQEVIEVMQSTDEARLLVGLELAEKWDAKVILGRLPPALLGHPSATVQERVVKFLSACPNQGLIDGYLMGAAKEVDVTAIRRALAAHNTNQNPRWLDDAISELYSEPANWQVHERLVEFGEAAVKHLKAALFDTTLAREVRLDIPATLGKIESQKAMDVLFTALDHEDGGIRYKVFLALEEMARRFANLQLDRQAIENAIVADTVRFYKRFVSYHVLFNDWQEPPVTGSWLLRQALLDSMERVKERALYLLSLIYSRNEISPAFAALRSDDPLQRAYGIELLDNLLTGKVKRHLFPLFDDAPADRQNQKFLDLLGRKGFSRQEAVEGLLQQEDMILAAATIWEIGVRGLVEFKEQIASMIQSENLLVKEAAERVLSGEGFERASPQTNNH